MTINYATLLRASRDIQKYKSVPTLLVHRGEIN